MPPDAGPKVKTIQTQAGHQILIDDSAQSVTITDSNANTITLDSSGITLARGGMKIEISDAKVSVNSGALEVI